MNEDTEKSMKTPKRRNSWGRRKIIDQEIEAYPPDLRDLFAEDDSSVTGSVIESPSISNQPLSQFPFALACREFENTVMSLKRNVDVLISRLNAEKDARECLEKKIDRLEDDKKAAIKRETEMLETIRNIQKKQEEFRNTLSDSVEESKKSVSRVEITFKNEMERISSSIRDDMKQKFSEVQNAIDVNAKSIEIETKTRSKEILSTGSKMNNQAQNLERLQMILFEIKQKNRESDEHLKELAQTQEESEAETKRLVQASNSEIESKVDSIEKSLQQQEKYTSERELKIVNENKNNIQNAVNELKGEITSSQKESDVKTKRLVESSKSELEVLVRDLEKNLEDRERKLKEREEKIESENKENIESAVKTLKLEIATCQDTQTQNTEDLRDLLEGLLAKEQNERERVEGKISEMFESVNKNMEKSRQSREHLRSELLDVMQAHTERERSELMQKLSKEVREGSRKRDELLSKIASEQMELKNKKNWTPDQMVNSCMVYVVVFFFLKSLSLSLCVSLSLLSLSATNQPTTTIDVTRRLISFEESIIVVDVELSYVTTAPSGVKTVHQVVKSHF
jgi:hypothetical protein